MRFKKFVALGILIIGYVFTSYIIFSSESVETMTSEGDGGELGSGEGIQQVGIGDSVTVVVTHVVKYNNYWFFLPVPVRRGELNLDSYHFWFFNIIIPFTTFVFIVFEIYNQGKKWENESIEVVLK